MADIEVTERIAATAAQLYDMEVEGLGTFRVAEHFTIEAGAITRVRQVHDTHALRQAGDALGPTERRTP